MRAYEMYQSNGEGVYFVAFNGLGDVSYMRYFYDLRGDDGKCLRDLIHAAEDGEDIALLPGNDAGNIALELLRQHEDPNMVASDEGIEPDMVLGNDVKLFFGIGEEVAQ